MKRTLIFAALMLLLSCGSNKSQITLLDASAFECSLDGKPIGLYTLRGGNLVMQVTNYGHSS